MEHYDKFKIYAGSFLLILILLMNIYIAANYYDLNKRKLPQFFIWQTNIEKIRNND
ncbi:MAG: hypothetical protein JWR38_474 [Mucilaginibacter sp.]|nr:hypothetical protein [Mucilaginibacter sp.]